MRRFAYTRAGSLAEAARAGPDTGSGEVGAPTAFLAGGTTLIDLMKLDVLHPGKVVDLGGLAGEFSDIESGPAGLGLGAFATMSAVGDNADVRRDYPVIAQSLNLAASAQLRNMATLGGNLLQRTRCPYYRDVTWAACNKREPGSGCSALHGVNRNHAVLGVSETCISQYPGDLAVALVALDARLNVSGPQGARSIAVGDLHRSSDDPARETTLAPGEIITRIHVPAGPWTRRSLYLKIRDRESYEFAVSSAAVALDIQAGVVRAARIGLGGMAYRPWRARDAEAALVGAPLTQASAEAAAKVALAGAVTHGGNAYKPELARRTLVRALLSAAALEV